MGHQVINIGKLSKETIRIWKRISQAREPQAIEFCQQPNVSNKQFHPFNPDWLTGSASSNLDLKIKNWYFIFTHNRELLCAPLHEEPISSLTGQKSRLLAAGSFHLNNQYILNKLVIDADLGFSSPHAKFLVRHLCHTYLFHRLDRLAYVLQNIEVSFYQHSHRTESSIKINTLLRQESLT